VTPEPSTKQGIADADVEAVTAQLGRKPRAVREVAHRCPCGLPAVVQTSPRLEDGTPFPTLYYMKRDAIEPLGTDVSAGGMPGRVKCLHVCVAHALAAGPGVNPFGDEALAEIGEWWRTGPCVTP
jgi:uncharacterized protein